jgi:hypothetical protein
MGTPLAFTVHHEAAYCCVCGVVFSMPEALLAKRRSDKKDFFCPNGHQQAFTENEADKLRRELIIEKTARITAEKKLTDQLTRVSNGVCPCCKRSFQNLLRHMKTKHPEVK